MPELTKIQTGFLDAGGPFKLDPGTESAPGIHFEGDENTGFYRAAENELALSVDGSEKYKFTSEGLKFSGTSLDGTPFIGKIQSSLNETIVDAFVYDTSQDSDGGEWRNRVDNLSWYNETLNTLYRGSRREFPSIAIIVATASTITIYDGDDPSVPMWMVFSSASSASMLRSGAITSICMMNAELWIGHDSGSGVHWINFLKDTARWITASSSYGGYYRDRTIANRNTSSTGGYFNNIGGSNSLTITGSSVYDLAITVLPNAKIDEVTKIEIPTVAIVTSGGLSVIGDDFVFNRSHGYSGSMRVSIDGDVVLVTHNGPTSGQTAETFYTGSMRQIGDGNTGPAHGDNTLSTDQTYYGFGYYFNKNNSNQPMWTRNMGTTNTPIVHKEDLYFGYWLLVRVRENRNFPGHGMLNYTTGVYNTGWMYGNTLGVYCCSNSTVNISGSEMVTNGYFTSTSNWTSSSAYMTISTSNNELTGTKSGGTGVYWAYQEMNLTVGQEYMVTAFLRRGTGANSFLRIGHAGSTNLVYGIDAYTTSTSGEYITQYFTPTQSAIRIMLLGHDGADGTTAHASLVSVRPVDADRSTINRGPAIVGNINREVVESNADLVAYNGFGATNYLLQPYDSEIASAFDGNFYVSGWFKTSDFSSDNQYLIWYCQENSNQLPKFEIYISGGNFGVYSNDNVYVSNMTFSTDLLQRNKWTHFVFQRCGEAGNLYINGQLMVSSQIGKATLGSSKHRLHIGSRSAGGYYWRGSVALVKVGGGTPIDHDKIKEIYEDEKVMFEPGAKCTIHGSTGIVNRMAYDKAKNILHVGTNDGRSDFKGFLRINNTTTAVNNAISAHDGFIVES